MADGATPDTSTATPAPASAPATAPATAPAGGASTPAGAPPAGGLAAAAAAEIAATPPGTPAPATPPAAYYPEGLPDTLRGKSDRETIDALWKAQAEAPKPPAAATDYKLEIPKDLAGFIDPQNDSVLPLFRDVALKNGLTQGQFQNTVVELHQAMAKAGMLQPLVDVGAEYRELGGPAADPAAQMQKGKERAANVATQVGALVTRQQMPKDVADALLGNLGSAKVIVAVETLLKMLPAEQGVTPGGGGGGGAGLTPEQAAAAKLFPSMKVA
jgi:hypothetical protein